MKRAAIGIRAHSGWGAVVVVTGSPGALSIVDRRRIVITDPNTAGAKQPYHFAKGQKIEEAEIYLANCAAVSARLAREALGDLLQELQTGGYSVENCSILMASGRALPLLPQILASHSLIHTAEGEFFRRAFRTAGERLEIGVTGIRERDLEERAQAVFGGRATQVQQEIAGLGGSLGPPWTADQKTATLAALLALASRPHQKRPTAASGNRRS